MVKLNINQSVNIMARFNRLYIKTLILLIIVFVGSACSGNSSLKSNESFITTTNSPGYFTLSADSVSTPLFVSGDDFPGVLRVLNLLQTDIANVTDTKPEILTTLTNHSDRLVIIGTVGKSPTIDKLITDHKIDGDELKGKWEKFVIQVVKNPIPNVDEALVVAGSDKRGTIYGMFDISEKIGVSPWYWWADVPVRKKSALYVKPGKYSLGEPAVKYRGIFINDEEPALGGWVRQKFGDFNAKFYDHVFELILRLKGNFLWPAMWGKAFYDDDPQNPILANEYGVVISTSHHEPMMRAHVEWQRYGSGPWNYSKNEAELKKFWRKGIERMDDNESIVTLAMRGDGDEAMSQDANVGLLEKIVKDQREIIKEVTGKKIESIPQVWALYKEVQEYYDKGMRVPDDVTILLCDDNWGNIRKLPRLNEKPRSGGFGIYYHFDYVGGPRNYKWLNTNPIARVWEQMHLAYKYGADRIWVVNVGDIKPMDFSISFFLDYAWNPDAITADMLPEYTQKWVEKQFGEKNSKQIADIITAYLKFNSRRKPELLSPDTYSLTNYQEAENVVREYNDLMQKAKDINDSLPAESRDAFYELVLHPVEACANLNDLYVTVGLNRLYARQGRAVTNDLAERARALFKKDAEITKYYNQELAGGKWNHMMDQTHIGYTYWQQPDENTMPEVATISLNSDAQMGVAIQGSDKWWPDAAEKAILPEFDPYHDQKFYIEIFNRGIKPFEYTTVPGAEWINISEESGTILTEQRLWISIDWSQAPEGMNDAPITISGSENTKTDILVKINNPKIPKPSVTRFVEGDGYISIEAEHFSRKIKSSGINWLVIPDFGRTLSGVTPVPVTSPEQRPEGDSPHLEYDVYLFSTGEVNVDVYLAPTLNFNNLPDGIRYAVSFDDEKPQIINMTSNPNPPDLNHDGVWNKWVSENINIQTSTHTIMKPGKHILKFWMVDPAVVLEKIVIKTHNIPSSYLGPPERPVKK